MEDMWYVYILVCNDTTLYTGIAKNPSERLKKHMRGQGAAYTKMRIPIRIIYTEQAATRSDALKREHEIKQWTRTQKIHRLRLEIQP